MMNTKPLKVSDIIEEDDLYFASDASKYWISGIVSEWGVPHVTLLWGLMQSGPAWKKYIDIALDGWSLPTVTVDSVDFFESNYKEDPYYCIIAKLKVTDELSEGNFRLRMLPHIDSFPNYTPHITLAYIRKDETVRDQAILALNERFAGKKIQTTGINYGKS